MDHRIFAAAFTFIVYWPLLTLGSVWVKGHLASVGTFRKVPPTVVAGCAVVLGFALAAFGAWNAFHAPPPMSFTYL